MRFQVRKHQASGMWEVWVLGLKSWVRVEAFHNWKFAMRLATGQDPYTGGVYLRSIVTVTW